MKTNVFVLVTPDRIAKHESLSGFGMMWGKQEILRKKV